MAGAKGLEPSTSCVTGRRSNQLNYAPKGMQYYKRIFTGFTTPRFRKAPMHRLMIFLSLMAALSSQLIASPYQTLGLSIDIPNGWQIVGESKNWVSFVATPQLVTVSITRQISESGAVPTPGAIQQKRASLFFDGWMNLYSRDSTPTENLPLQATARRISAYGKIWLNDQNKPVRRVVIEHYMIKQNVAYTVTIDVMEHNWKRLESQIKTMINSMNNDTL